MLGGTLPTEHLALPLLGGGHHAPDSCSFPLLDLLIPLLLLLLKPSQPAVTPESGI